MRNEPRVNPATWEGPRRKEMLAESQGKSPLILILFSASSNGDASSVL